MIRRFIRSYEINWEIQIRLIFAAVLAAIMGLVLDMFSDYFGWYNLSHFVIEGFAVVLLISLLFYLLRLLIQLRWEAVSWERRANNAESDADKWKQEIQEIGKGLANAIDQQFEKWKFTKAEKEIGILMLKGMIFKEIAQIRSTSERTVRQQALEIYRKSSVSGRNEFSAYFLEDLLFPLEAE
ncbi:MAG: helix-turn-helix transcriptional regulator [SAR324 cluster bacterium]|nr:helix-turn-helix transcriptional regulator [SAR324 cluster bacterium]